MAITIDGTNGLTTDNAALKLDGTTLVVDDTNNRVGVGTASPAVALDVSGYARASSGILFGTDTAAANALDDYEEGTWTPVAASDSGSITSYTASGTYVKVGKIVQVAFKVALTDVGTAGGKLRLTLPFTAVNFIRPGTGVVREDQVNGVGYLSYCDPNSTFFYIGTFTNGGISWTNGYGYVGSFTYQTT